MTIAYMNQKCCCGWKWWLNAFYALYKMAMLSLYDSLYFLKKYLFRWIIEQQFYVFNASEYNQTLLPVDKKRCYCYFGTKCHLAAHMPHIYIFSDTAIVLLFRCSLNILNIIKKQVRWFISINSEQNTHTCIFK